jgi:hypothetical protein
LVGVWRAPSGSKFELAAVSGLFTDAVRWPPVSIGRGVLDAEQPANLSVELVSVCSAHHLRIHREGDGRIGVADLCLDARDTTGAITRSRTLSLFRRLPVRVGKAGASPGAGGRYAA